MGTKQSAKVVERKAAKLAAQAEKARIEAAELKRLEEELKKSKKEQVKEVRAKSIPDPTKPDEDSVVKAINYGNGSKDKNIISFDDLAKFIRKRDANITSYNQAKENFKVICDAISDAMMEGYGIQMVGNEYAIGILHLRPLKGTTRRNLKTGEPVESLPKVSIRLRARKSSTVRLKSLRKELTDKFGSLMK